MSNDVTPGAEKRPDGRDASDETVALRVATRALRDHLDQLPIDYTTDTYPDRFLGGLAFMFARQRFDCADSMIGSGFGGTVIGSLGRSLLVDGLRWLWIAEEPRRLRSLLGDLLMERSRLSKLLDRADASCPIFARWLMPLPAIADLTGASLAWLDATESPSDDELLEDFINSSPGAGQPGASQDGSDSDLLGRTRTLMSMAGLHGISMVLAHAARDRHIGTAKAPKPWIPGFALDGGTDMTICRRVPARFASERVPTPSRTSRTPRTPPR